MAIQSLPYGARGSSASIFPTFLMAGYECSTFIWKDRRRKDFVALTGHERCLDADYDRVVALGVGVVREAVRWPMVDRGGGFYDWTSVDPVVAALNAHGLTPIWDLCHYGLPDGCDPFDPGTVQRFAAYCRAVAEHVASRVGSKHFFTPLNEINFFAGAATDKGWMYPFARGRYDDLKLALCRMDIAGVHAIREVLPHARMVHVDPIIHEVAPPNRPDLAREAAFHVEHQCFEAWDILAGRLHPELGGAPEVLDVVGVNVYHHSQAELGNDGERTILEPDDPRRQPVGDVVSRAWERYRRPVLIAETSGFGDRRASWLAMLMKEACRLLEKGVDLQGICLYPFVDIPEWETGEWSHLGVYDLADLESCRRVPCAPYLAEIEQWQRRLAGNGNGRARGARLADVQTFVAAGRSAAATSDGTRTETNGTHMDASRRIRRRAHPRLDPRVGAGAQLPPAGDDRPRDAA
jgi:hypothetical protein